MPRVTHPAHVGVHAEAPWTPYGLAVDRPRLTISRAAENVLVFCIGRQQREPFRNHPSRREVVVEIRSFPPFGSHLGDVVRRGIGQVHSTVTWAVGWPKVSVIQSIH